MMPLAAALLTAGTALLAWTIAHRAARVRSIAIGAFPAIPAAAAAVVAAVACARGGTAYGAVAALAIVSVAGEVDRRCGAIFDALSLALSLAAALAAVCAGTMAATLCGAACAGGAMLALYLITHGRGIGLGDVKLATGLGASLGPAGGTVALGAAFVAGGCYGAWLLGTRRARRGSAIRFGPFLAAGTYAAVLLPATSA